MKTETLEQSADSIATRGLPFSAFRNESEWKQTKEWLTKEIATALNAERERALNDAARQECVFCAGADGYNSTPVQAALPIETDAGNYVHRNDPPHGLAGVYCKAPRIRALITAAKGVEVKTNAD